MKKTFLQRLGLLGLVSFLSYTAAVVFARWPIPDTTGWRRRSAT